MTRDEHLAWAKQRALEYIDAGELTNAITSMSSDIQKFPDMYNPTVLECVMADGILFQLKAGPDAMRRWINGFN